MTRDMEREQKIKEIRKVCIEANKSILDLKFGCWVRCEWRNKSVRHLVVNKANAGVYVVQSRFGEPSSAVTKKVHERDLTVIGRDIRQDDCAQIVSDVHTLADMWKPGLLQDQDELAINWIYENSRNGIKE